MDGTLAACVLHGDPQVLQGREHLQPLPNQPECPEVAGCLDMAQQWSRGVPPENTKQAELQLKTFTQTLHNILLQRT